MSLHKEISFEDEICGYLAANGWLYVEGDAALYDRARALFPSDLIAWVQATQPKAWETLVKNHGRRRRSHAAGPHPQAARRPGNPRRIAPRRGADRTAPPHCARSIQASHGDEPDIVARYAANRLRIVRQVRYSLANENCIDLVLFLNGVPVATAELKTDFTQSVEDAIDQYRFDRHPRPKGQSAEPLLNFPSGAVVHFAVSNSEVHMTTQLAGPATSFLPFNKGDHGAKGNPPNPRGHRTSYLWEETWQRESWLEIIGRYLVTPRDEKKKIKSIIFPRYHQLDATRKLQAKVLEEGAGGKFLIQHSAGSGKDQLYRVVGALPRGPSRRQRRKTVRHSHCNF
jgi:type I restriction enzyme R subunit